MDEFDHNANAVINHLIEENRKLKYLSWIM